MSFKYEFFYFLRQLRKYILVAAAVLFIALAVLTAVTYISVKDRVTSYTLFEPIEIYDRNEEIADYLSKQKGENVDIEDIPLHLQNAFIAVEDKRFYSHHGIDLLRVGKAFMVNLSKGRISQGGSTISQQLAKNAFLSHERTLSRKFKEAVITLEIERVYSKKEILEKYLNEIYFGSGSYGVREAARDIFDKKVSEINLAEAAMLAGIPNRPSTYNPRKNLKKSLERGRLILRLMLKQGYITEDEYNAAVQHKFVEEEELPRFFIQKKDTSIIVKSGRKKRQSKKAPDFVDAVETRLLDFIDINTFSKGGLKVYTSLDPDMQAAAKESFESYQYFKRDVKLQGALITLDAENGEVLSIIGGKEYHSGNFNRAIDAKKQVGSTFKPFVYYTALESGYTMNQMIDASTTAYGDWTPRNYGNSSFGNMTLIQSLEKSVNTAAVRLLKDVGINKVVENFKKTGADIPVEENLTLALGSMSTSPLELAASYIPFANGGYSFRPSFIRRIEDSQGNILYEREEVQGVEAYDTINTSLMTYMLQQVVENGSGKGSKLYSRLGLPVDQAGKTGTSNDFRSAWYAGFTPEYVSIVYIGYDDNTSMPNGSSGGRMAAPLWKNYYQKMINKGIYTPGSFEFIDENIKNGELVARNIDIRSGEVQRVAKNFRRKVLFKKDQAPDTPTRKFFKKIFRSFF